MKKIITIDGIEFNVIFTGEGNYTYLTFEESYVNWGNEIPKNLDGYPKNIYLNNNCEIVD